VSQKGEWSAWIDFFLRGVAEQSTDAIERTKSLLALHKQFIQKLQSARNSALLHQLIDQLFISPVISIPKAAEILQVTYPAAKTNVQKLIDAGILCEAGDHGGARLYISLEILKAVNTDNDRMLPAEIEHD